MSFDDFDVIVYKVLEYIYACLKEGVQPSLAKAQEIAKCNDIYWTHVIQSMKNDELIQGVIIKSYLDAGNSTLIEDNLGITQKGASYLRDNSNMQKVKSFLGKAFIPILEAAVLATKAL